MNTFLRGLSMIRQLPRLACLAMAFTGLAASAQAAKLPGWMDGTGIGCIPPAIGTSPASKQAACYYSELTSARRDLRDLNRQLFDLASYAERDRLRNMQTAWQEMRENYCRLLEGLEPNMSNAINVKNFCDAVLTRQRLAELQRLAEPLLARREVPVDERLPEPGPGEPEQIRQQEKPPGGLILIRPN